MLRQPANAAPPGQASQPKPDLALPERAMFFNRLGVSRLGGKALSCKVLCMGLLAGAHCPVQAEEGGGFEAPDPAPAVTTGAKRQPVTLDATRYAQAATPAMPTAAETTDAEESAAPATVAEDPAPPSDATLPGVTVYGTKQERDRQRTAESVQVFTDVDLQQRAITTVNEAVARTPNATVQYGSDRFVQIRGFTNSNSSRPAITLTQDGVERDGIGFALSDSLWDVE
jgi:hypothetical protein